MENIEIEIEERLPKETQPQRVKNAFAAWVTNPYGSIQLYGDISPILLSGGTNEPDKMKLPTDYKERIAWVRYYYEVDPIASTAINKIIDVGINKLVFDRNNCTDEEFTVYQTAEKLFLKYLKEAALEYLLSGLVVPQAAWRQFTPDELNLDTVRRYELPEKCWIIDPFLLTLQWVPFSTDVEVYMMIPENIRKFVLEGGKRPDGSTDTETMSRLTEEFPEFVNAIKKGQSTLLLEKAFVIRRRPKTYDPNPTPYLLSALESLAFKRNLKKMDYAIASRVIGAIQLIKLGNDDFPLTEDDEDQLDDLKTQMLWRSQPKNIDRVFQLFANHTLNIEWIYPDTEAMLNQEKYQAVNEDIFNALGMPRILVSGETLRSATSQAEFAMFSPAETIKRFREDILLWVEELIDQIKTRNSFENRIKVSFEELRLYDLGKLTEIATTLYQNNALSLTSLAGIAGYNFEEELEKKSTERELMKEFDVPEVPALPFSPKPSVPGEPVEV